MMAEFQHRELIHPIFLILGVIGFLLCAMVVSRTTKRWEQANGYVRPRTTKAAKREYKTKLHMSLPPSLRVRILLWQGLAMALIMVGSYMASR